MVARLWLCGHRVADSEADRVVSGSVRGAGVCDGREHKWVEAIYDHGGQLGSERSCPALPLVSHPFGEPGVIPRARLSCR